MSSLYAMIMCAIVAFSAIILNVLLTLFPNYTTYIIVGYLAVLVTGVSYATGYKIYEISTRVKHRKKMIREITKHINPMVIVWDADFSYIDVNDDFTKNLGYTAADLMANKDYLRKVLPADAFQDNLQAIINNRDEEFYATAYDGSKICTIWNTSMIYTTTINKKTTYLLMSIGPNLTETINMKSELMRYSKELAESENKYMLSMELAEIGLMLKEPGGSRFYISEQLQAMLGIEEEFISSADLRALFHPKDRIIFDSFAGSTGNRADDKAGQIHSVEFRAITPDMTYHWFQFRYKTMSNKNVLQASIGGAVIDITKEKEKDSLIEKMAYVDDVTQIFNRNKFMMTGEELLAWTKDDPALDYWLIVIDIDGFHIINDTCGYANGNKLLADVAAIITSCLTEGGFAARIGGDNFAVLIKANGDDELPVEIIKRIQSDILSIHSDSLETHSITCSAGFCKMSDGKDEFSKVLDRAEFALSLSDGTRSSIIRYDSTVHDKIIKGTEIEKDLTKALENNELVLYYQPKIDLTTGIVMGMEALIRWIKPDGRIVPPSEFIPVAESSLLITKISKFVLYEACRQNKKWQDIGLAPVTVSINLTAIDFYQTNVTETIKKALADTGLEPQWLDVELTESLALKDIDHAIQQMNEIKELGVKLSMDDFGTGYSSLSYIQVLPITLLKLDRSFIMYLEEDEISREIVSAVIRIAKSKHIETVAEGIETSGQAQILKQSGCDWAQGYFFGKPMPADQFEEFLRMRQNHPAEV
ncbi:MAG: EAL domain-containing protein [Oscillospiraceae bacterium]|nr:EAL domain-containing protein [Oscillospiraceae bacterium]